MGKRKNKRMKEIFRTLTAAGLTFFTWLAAFAVVVGIAVWAYRAVWLVSQLRYANAQEGTVKHEYAVRILVANEETLVLSPATGTPVYLKPDGARFRRSESLGTIGSQGPAVTAPVAGLFFPCKDGLEELLTAQNLMNADLEKLIPEVERMLAPKENAQGTEQNEKAVLVRIDSATANGVLGKMVNNLSASWAFVRLPSRVGILKGDELQFLINGTTRKAYVERLTDTPRGAVIRFEFFLEESSCQRVLDVFWIQKKAQKGIVIPRTALVYQGEECGVYIVDAGVIRFKRVKVIDENNTLACVENLKAETRIVENPRPGIAGLKVP